MTERDKQRLEALLGPFSHMCPLAHFCFDDEGTVVSASGYAQARYQEVFHHSLMGVNILREPVAVPPVLAMVQEHQHGRKIVHVNIKEMRAVEHFNARNAQDYISLMVLTMPICTPEGEFVANYMLLRDISAFQREHMQNHLEAMQQQREELEETINTLRQDKAEAEEKELGMGTLLSNMGHDLRSPLGTIKGFVELLINTDDSVERAEYYKIIKSSVEQMTMLVNDILEADRLETGRMKYTLTSFAVSDMMSELYQSFLLRFNDLPIELVYTPYHDEMVITSDMQRVLEVLGNYIGNAIKYTNEGSVTLSYEPGDGGVYMHVIDTGRGIAPENHDKIFNRFEMLGSEIKGNGLGLYICREIANGLGGRVGVNSALGRGSDFWVWLPITAEQ